ncbi:MAG: hybrid sensor histidine kinase/response regulator [Candidatus Omnitrophota bacterium]|nr:hybrid sensor histidine kinase/response regulator [Candidatus Omnitrophota bacterium]MDZ4243413.1 hybrid sensor histidine kinase/response regulator [Candidatus Omnitrophota bacterium]
MQRILIVDDSPFDREFIKEILLGTNLKYELVEAESGMHALEIVRANAPDVILLDIQMANLNGFETLTELRKMEDRLIPTILVSSFTHENDRIRGIQLGAADFINKPIIPEELTARVASYLSLKKMYDDIQWVMQKTNDGIRLLYKELERKNKELQKIDQMKDDFVATVSHELRTPLTIINEGLSLMLDRVLGDLPAQQEDVLRKSKKNVERLISLINDLLDMAKIEAGKIELRLASKDINAIVQSVVDSHFPLIRSKKVSMNYSGPGHEVLTSVDEDKIVQVLNNLLNNAFKFTPEGGHIEVSLAVQDMSVLCAVKDSGIGISKEDMEKLFNKFEQFSHKYSPGVKGTGLGLAICKSLIDLHGGKIWAHSEPGHGTTFYFALPKK